MKGLRLNIVRPIGPDTTNNGVSANTNTVTLIGTHNTSTNDSMTAPKSAQVFEATDAAPEVLLVLGPNNTAHLAPLVGLELQPVAGGNFAYTSDSRLRDFFDQLGVFPFYGAIAVHDRFES